MEEFDINKVAAEFLSSQIGEIGETGKFFLKESVANIKLSLKIVYTNYLKRVYERYGKCQLCPGGYRDLRQKRYEIKPP